MKGASSQPLLAVLFSLYSLTDAIKFHFGVYFMVVSNERHKKKGELRSFGICIPCNEEELARIRSLTLGMQF